MRCQLRQILVKNLGNASTTNAFKSKNKLIPTLFVFKYFLLVEFFSGIQVGAPCPCHYLTWSREQCLQSHAPCRQTVQETAAGILLPALSDVPSNSWNSRGICPTGGTLDSSFLVCIWGTSISMIVSSSADLKAEDLLHTRSRNLSFDLLYSEWRHSELSSSTLWNIPGHSQEQ